MKLPIGYDNFAEIINSNLDFIDKSLFIKEVLDNHIKVSVITRPRRFGKTFNLSMLHHFLAWEIKGQSTRSLFNGLKITELEEYMQHQGQYPVVAITFKDIKNLDFETAYQKICDLIGDVYNEHNYLLSSPHLSTRDKTYFQKVLDSNPPQATLEESLKKLTEYLFKHYGKQPWLLIDEYDSPIHAAFFHGYYDRMVALIRGLLGSALKGNEFVKRAVVTGIMRVSKESLFSGVNNVIIYSMLNSKYGEYFGFTESEVSNLLEKSGLTHLTDKIRQWYNGYQIKNITLYNPWSILNCLDNQGELKPYWVNTSDNVLLKQLLARCNAQMKMELESLLLNETISAPVDENIVFGELEKNSGSLWSFLIATGYLKAIHIQWKEAEQQCELAIPNQEIFALYRKLIKDWLGTSFGYEQYLTFILSLTQGLINDFAQYLQKYLLETASYFDSSGTEPEKFYHGFVLGLMVTLSESHEIQSNRESGFGRYDVMLIPKDPEQLGIILEFKTVREPDADLKQAAIKAVEQITQRRYEITLKQKGIHRMVKVGLAFRGKEVEVYSVLLPEVMTDESVETGVAC